MSERPSDDVNEELDGEDVEELDADDLLDEDELDELDAEDLIEDGGES